jgi:xanthine dehydrogenase accessory factor
VVLVATQGQGDEEALELALRCSAEHVLMIASHRKAERLREVMRMRGIEESRLASLLAPAGPDVGAKTPAEIALVSMAGVLACLRGRPAARAAGKAEGSASTTRDPRSEKPGTPVAAAAPGTFINPVCGVAVSTTDPKHVENYEGVAYYFCCDGCWTTFRRDPARYAAIHHASTASASA